MKVTPLYLAALAVEALSDVDVVGTSHPFITTPDFAMGGVLDAQGGRWIVKLPRNAVAGTALEAEVALAPGLAAAGVDGSLPFDVVKPAGFATVRPHGRALVYPEPFGTPVRIDTINRAMAANIGRALGALHELDSSLWADAGVPVYDAEGWRARFTAELNEASETGAVPKALITRWEQCAADDHLWRMSTVPVHGDLDDAVVMWNGSEITAITGFGESHVGDPALDFVWLANVLDDDALDAVTEAYAVTRSAGSDAYLRERVQLLSEFALARWLLHGRRIGDDQIQSEARQMLRELADRVESDPDLSPGPRWRTDPDQADGVESFEPDSADTAPAIDRSAATPAK